MIRGLKHSSGIVSASFAAASIFCGLGLTRPAAAQEAHPEDAAIIRHLNTAITWYKQLMSINESAGQPSDAFYLDNARSVGRQAVQLAFQSAEGEAALLIIERSGVVADGNSGQSSETSDENKNIKKAAVNTAALITQTQSQIEALNGQIAKTSGKKQQELASRREILQEQLEFNTDLAGGTPKAGNVCERSKRKGKRAGERNRGAKEIPARTFCQGYRERVPSTCVQAVADCFREFRAIQSGRCLILPDRGPARDQSINQMAPQGSVKWLAKFNRRCEPGFEPRLRKDAVWRIRQQRKISPPWMQAGQQ